MPITEDEKKIYEDKIEQLNHLNLTEWASSSFSDEKFRAVFSKILYNLIGESVQLKKEIADALLVDDREVNVTKDVFANVLLSAYKVALKPQKKRVITVKETQRKEIKGYTTGQMAEFFSVSITTVNNWISEGRFHIEQEHGKLVQVTRKSTNEKLRIHPNTWFDAPSGVRYQVKDVIEAYIEDKREWEASKNGNTVATEEEQVKLFVEHFQNKYDGQDYEEVFGNRNWDELTAEEETDAAMWSFFLQRITDEKGTHM